MALFFFLYFSKNHFKAQIKPRKALKKKERNRTKHLL